MLRASKNRLGRLMNLLEGTPGETVSCMLHFHLAVYVSPLESMKLPAFPRALSGFTQPKSIRFAPPPPAASQRILKQNQAKDLKPTHGCSEISRSLTPALTCQPKALGGDARVSRTVQAA